MAHSSQEQGVGVQEPVGREINRIGPRTRGVRAEVGDGVAYGEALPRRTRRAGRADAVDGDAAAHGGEVRGLDGREQLHALRRAGDGLDRERRLAVDRRQVDRGETAADPASGGERGELLACAGTKAVDQGGVQGAGEGRRAGDLELIVLCSGGRAADLDVQAAAAALLVIAV